GGLVLHDAVPGDPEAGERRPQGGQAADDHGPLQRADPRRGEGPRQDDGTDARDDEESGSEEHTPQPTPEGPDPAPGLHAIAGVVVADHVLLGVVVLAHDGELLHVEAPALKRLYRLLRFVVGVVDGDCDLFGIWHGMLLSCCMVLNVNCCPGPYPLVACGNTGTWS